MASHTSSKHISGTIHPAVADDLKSHMEALRRYSRALVGNVADADDLVQETLKRALTYAHSGKDIRNPRSYLLTMLHHVRVDHARRERSTDRRPLEEHTFPVCRATQSDRIVCGEVVAAIKELPKEQRDVLLLAGVDDLAYRDIADRLNIPIGTVMSRLSRGRRALQTALDPEAAPASVVVAGRARWARRAAERTPAAFN
ncbi:RNA polymerase sigma factor [Shumkonia mesophila]|uniref:RNA polymerase sigma factor n=1 Tax=Shumkonia mesophila TaxID=2838854 RepID=UPI002934C8CD|nr:RNA polymerase sigma factor [Shumkonia mesophila]